MKRAISIFLLICIALSAVACGKKETDEKSEAVQQSKMTKLKLGHQLAINTPEGEALQWFADQVKERTKGEIEITVYPNEELGDAATNIDMVKLGTCDLTITSVALFAPYNGYFNIGTVPFLYKDNSIAAEMNAGEIGKQEIASLRENGMQLVNTDRNFYRGPYRVLVSKTPIKSLDDIQGLRFRAYENKVYMGAWSALGANPIVVAWTETYSALSQGTVDAATSTIGQLKGVKFTEIAPYVTRINEYAAEAILVCNAKKWDSLTPEQQKIITECANDAGKKMDELSEAAIQKDINDMKAAGATFNDIDTTPFREKLINFYHSLEEDGTLPKGLVDKALDS